MRDDLTNSNGSAHPLLPCFFRRHMWSASIVVGTVVLWSSYSLTGLGLLQNAEAPVIFITGGTLIDGTGRPPLTDAGVLIDAGRIKQVGKSTEIRPPAGATLINAQGKFILPGLIDAHVHYRDWVGELFLAHGVTSVFDMGDPTDWILAVREATAMGLIRGPRLYVSGNLIDGVSDSPRASMGGASLDRRRYNRTRVRSVEEARDAVRALVQRGVDFIKVYQDLTLEQLAAVVEEVHRSGLAVVGHTDDASADAKAGIDGITHLWGIALTCMSIEEREQYDESRIPSPYPYLKGPILAEVIRTLVGEDVYVNPLLVNEHASVNQRTSQHRRELFTLLGRPSLGYVPLEQKLAILSMSTRVRNYASQFGLFPPLLKLQPQIQEKFRTGYLRAQEFVRAFVKAGGKLFLGSDSAGASIVAGLSVHHELELLVDSGIAPMQAIQFATQAPAELIGRGDEIGTIEAGKLADLIILEGDPLANISNTKKISIVIKDGIQVDTSYHRNYSNLIPYPVHEYSSSYNPVPTVSDILPKGTTVAGDGFKMTIRGRGFVLTSGVELASRRVETRFVSPTQLEALLPAELFGSVGTLPVRVVNPQPGGGKSNPFGFVVAPR